MAYDLMPTTQSQRVITIDKYLDAPAKLSRVGIQRYRVRELRGADGLPIFPDKQPDDIVTLYRPEEEVSDPESIASFEDMPITDRHPDPTAYPDGVTADCWKALAIGHVRDCKWLAKDNHVGGRVRISDIKGVSGVFSGRSQLSVGYGFQCEKKAGVAPDGQAYDGIMRKIRGNHLAIVDAARGGPGCRIEDHQPNGEHMDTVVITVDGVDYLVPKGTAATLIAKLHDERNAARADLIAKTTAHGAAVSKLAADHAEELGKLKTTTILLTAVDGLVRERVGLIGDCTVLCADIKAETLDTPALRRAMVEDLCKKNPSVKTVADAVLAGVALDKATDEQVTVVCNAAVASVKTQTTDSVARRDQIARAFAHTGDEGKGKTKNPDVQATDDIPDMSDETYKRNHFSGQKPAGK